MSTSRNTIQRDLVRQALCNLYHPTAEEVYAHIVYRHPTVSKATVYRNLSVLVDKGEIRRFSTDEASLRYDGNPAEHYHGKCKNCGKLIDIMPKNVRGAYQQVVDVFEQEGFEVERCEVVFYGRCGSCRS